MCRSNSVNHPAGLSHIMGADQEENRASKLAAMSTEDRELAMLEMSADDFFWVSACHYDAGRTKPSAVFLKRAASMGHVPSKGLLGVRCFFGDGVQKDKVKASEMFEELVELKHPVAMFALGILLVRENNKERGCSLIKDAADLGNALACQYLEEDGDDLNPLTWTLLKHRHTWNSCRVGGTDDHIDGKAPRHGRGRRAGRT